MKNIIRSIEAQGGSNAGKVFHSLLNTRSITEEVTADNLAVLLIGITAPDGADLLKYIDARLNATTDGGETFGDALVAILSAEPALLTVAQISVCHQQPWIRISCLDCTGDEVTEYETDNRPQSIRTETVISGGMIAFLNMKLKFPVTESGWK
jgi:hypothetical protein